MLVGSRIKVTNFLVLFYLFFLPLFSHAQVVINEIQVLPTGGKFLELHNTSDSSLDLTGWYIKKKTESGTESSLVVTSRFQDKSIPAGGYFLIANESTYTGDATINVGWPQSNTGVASNNTVIVYDNNNNEVDKVGWGNAGDCSNPCPPNPPSGQSIQKTTNGWIIASSTPGLANASSSYTPPNITASTTDQINATTTQQTNTNNTNDIKTGNTILSAHYGSAGLSAVESISKFQIGAGRERLGMVGTPIEFRPEMKYSYSGNMTFKWSFGDGVIGYGQVLSHSYAYPGDYVVVLNVTSPGGQAVTRTNVKIVPADIYISLASPERVEIFNDAKNEVNLFGRALSSQGKSFIFPEDTIIKAGQKISFAGSVTGLHPFNESGVSIDIVGDTMNKALVPAQATEDKIDNQKQIEILYTKAVEIQKALAMLSQDSNLAVQQPNRQNLATAFVALNSNSSTTATTTKVSHRGWLQTIREFFLGRK